MSKIQLGTRFVKQQKFDFNDLQDAMGVNFDLNYLKKK